MQEFTMSYKQGAIYNVLSLRRDCAKTSWQIAQETGIGSSRRVKAEIEILCQRGFPIVSVCHEKPKGYFLCWDKKHPEAIRYLARLKSNIRALAIRIKAFHKTFEFQKGQQVLFEERDNGTGRNR